jgi:hypothetical protein
VERRCPSDPFEDNGGTVFDRRVVRPRDHLKDYIVSVSTVRPLHRKCRVTSCSRRSCASTRVRSKQQGEPLGYPTVLKHEPTITNQHFALTIRVRSAFHTIGKTKLRGRYDDSMKTGGRDRLKDHLGTSYLCCELSVYNALPIQMSISWYGTQPLLVIGSINYAPIIKGVQAGLAPLTAPLLTRFLY